MLPKAAKIGARIKEVSVSMIYDDAREGRFGSKDVFVSLRVYSKF